MYKIILSILALIILNMESAIAKTVSVSGSGEFNDVQLEDVVVSGGAEATNSEFRTLVISGSIEFTNLKVDELFTVSGSGNGTGLHGKRLVVSGFFKGKNIILTGDAVLSGGFEVSHSEMKGLTKISGEFDARNSELQDLEIDSDGATISDSIVHNIKVNENKKSSDSQKIILKGQTIISGDIIFESGKGEIIADKQVVIKGKIEGGKLHKK